MEKIVHRRLYLKMLNVSSQQERFAKSNKHLSG